ncbi:unnamed protein product [Nezara viridula]|uniref:Uncharacterized protein n=1 Tax=Nezara viridula TaxID=85310 RepID=A0A9P0E7I8_NEZVI|nr:unnamed protein product [Nezara viridula]
MPSVASIWMGDCPPRKVTLPVIPPLSATMSGKDGSALRTVLADTSLCPCDSILFITSTDHFSVFI